MCKLIYREISHSSIPDAVSTHRKGLNTDQYVLKYAQRIVCLRSKKFYKESEELLENSNLFNFDRSAIQDLCIKCITLFDTLAMKYEHHKVENIIQVQAETLCGG